MAVSVRNGKRNVREEVRQFFRDEPITPAGVARECRIPDATLQAWLYGSGTISPAQAGGIVEFIAQRSVYRRVLSEVGNDLRANAVQALVSKAAKAVLALRDEVSDRDGICDQIGMYLYDISETVTLMGTEQTVRSAIQPGDRFVMIRNGGKKAAANE